MDRRLYLSLILCSSTFINVQSYPVLSKTESDDSLDRVVSALQERLASLEVAVASNDVNDQLNDLKRDLQDMKQENGRLRERLLRQEKNLGQLRRDNHHLCLQKLSHHSVHLTDQRLLEAPPTPQNIKDIVFVDRNLTDDSRFAMGAIGDGKSSAFSSGVKSVSVTNDLKIEGHLFKRQGQEGQVAFHAQVSAPDLENLGIHHIIIFDNVVTNIGGGYHPNTGIFMAPISGVYVFHVSAMSSPGKYQYVQLIKDGTLIQPLYADGHGVTNFVSTSITAPLELGKGSNVWVQTDTGMGTIHGNSFTIFTGFLLYPM